MALTAEQIERLRVLGEDYARFKKRNTYNAYDAPEMAKGLLVLLAERDSLKAKNAELETYADEVVAINEARHEESWHYSILYANAHAMLSNNGLAQEFATFCRENNIAPPTIWGEEKVEAWKVRNKELEAERDALRAEVERLRGALLEMEGGQ